LTLSVFGVFLMSFPGFNAGFCGIVFPLLIVRVSNR